MPRTASCLPVLAMLALVAGCSTTGEPVPQDPWQGINRPIHAFNDGLDTVILKPVAKGYEKVTPRFVRQGVSNFFRNLQTPWIGVNNLLQGKPKAATSDLGRLLLNSVMGLGGILDPATDLGLPRHDEDFGQTLGVWGAPSGPYLVLPFRGPTTLRDAFALPFNAAADPLVYVKERSVRDKLLVLQVIEVRQRLFAAEELISDSPDEYVTIRESFLQRREYLVHDGNPPIDDDFYDDLEDY